VGEKVIDRPPEVRRGVDESLPNRRNYLTDQRVAVNNWGLKLPILPKIPRASLSDTRQVINRLHHSRSGNSHSGLSERFRIGARSG